MRGKIYSFSLIELMVVIGIIMFLVSMFVPVLSKSRQKARQSACLNNLRQIGMATMAYSDYSDGFLPSAGMAEPVGHWLNYLYVEELSRERRVFQCPSLQPEDMFNPYGGDGCYGELERASYIMNVIRERNVSGWSYLSADISTPYSQAFGWINGNAATPCRDSQITAPSQKIFCSDSARGLTNTSSALGLLRLHETDHGLIDTNNNGYVNAGERQIGWHHQQGCNTLFGDMHGEFRVRTNHEEWNAVKK